MFGERYKNRLGGIKNFQSCSTNQIKKKQQRHSERKQVEMNPLKYFKWLLRVFNANRWVSWRHHLLNAKETVREKEKLQMVFNVFENTVSDGWPLYIDRQRDCKRKRDEIECNWPKVSYKSRISYHEQMIFCVLFLFYLSSGSL